MNSLFNFTVNTTWHLHLCRQFRSNFFTNDGSVNSAFATTHNTILQPPNPNSPTTNKLHSSQTDVSLQKIIHYCDKTGPSADERNTDTVTGWISKWFNFFKGIRCAIWRLSQIKINCIDELSWVCCCVNKNPENEKWTNKNSIFFSSSELSYIILISNFITLAVFNLLCSRGRIHTRVLKVWRNYFPLQYLLAVLTQIRLNSW